MSSQCWRRAGSGACGARVLKRAMGAYTWASASEFNFFPRATVVSVNMTPGDPGTVIPVPR